MAKVIVIMIDGISAMHFAKYRRFLPHLDHLAAHGLSVSRGVTPEMPGVSMPGRTSIIAGVPTAAHGIYANRIWDPSEQVFRWSNPYDVRCQTLPQLAQQQGLDVANIGYGMTRPEDCTLYVGPWWADDMLMRARPAQPSSPAIDDTMNPSDKQWVRAGATYDFHGRLQALVDAGAVEAGVVPMAQKQESTEHRMQLGMLADAQMLTMVGALATSQQAPDLLLAEIGMPDYYMHKYGQFSDLANFSLRTADAQVGSLLAVLRQSGRLQDYHLIICSDHGHTALRDALYVDRIVDANTHWVGEGSVLYVVKQSDAQAQRVEKQLVQFGVERWSNEHMPPERQADMLTFVAPAGSDMSFERAPEGVDDVRGGSKYQSNHGLRPGREEDYRFFIQYHVDQQAQTVQFATNDQVAPSIANLLGIETPWRAKPIGVT